MKSKRFVHHPEAEGGRSRRRRKVANLIRQVVSEALIGQVADPRVAFVTVTGVEVSADLRFADVGLSVMGDSRQQEECLRAVRHAHGFLQERVADAVQMKFCPVLRFWIDDSVKRSVSMSALIARARAEDEAARADRIQRGVEPGDEDDGP
jgi:ribosome-binding factor A